DFIVGLSKAKLKIGHANSTNPHFDLVIDTRGQQSLEYYLQQVKHYLSKMHRPK
ncbi:MAG: hypothetical protein RIS47_1636, partial [Bacteroidota bacterium]